MTHTDTVEYLALRISTHTPSWGVTSSHGYRGCSQHFYSHALVGRDLYPRWVCHAGCDFYSHALVGRDGLVG